MAVRVRKFIAFKMVTLEQTSDTAVKAGSIGSSINMKEVKSKQRMRPHHTPLTRVSLNTTHCNNNEYFLYRAAAIISIPPVFIARRESISANNIEVSR
jgi:hypothetical protein